MLGELFEFTVIISVCSLFYSLILCFLVSVFFFMALKIFFCLWKVGEISFALFKCMPLDVESPLNQEKKTCISVFYLC